MNKNKIENYQELFKTPNGEKVLADIVDYCGLFAVADTSHLELAEGKRRVAIYILNLINKTPEEVMTIMAHEKKMLKEQRLRAGL